MLDLYADQLGRSEEVDELVNQLFKRVQDLVEASQVAWSVGGMVDMLTSCAGADAVVVEE